MGSTLKSHHRQFRRRGERGVTVVVFAVSITAMLGVAALVLGGGTGYSAVRNAQNSADAAAVAGASVIRDEASTLRSVSAGQLADADANERLVDIGQDLYDTVESVVDDNGASLEPDGCVIVSAAYGQTNAEADTLGPCLDMVMLTNAELATVAGVRVTVGDTRDVPFSAFVDQDTITGNAVAAATVQPIRSGKMAAPFLVCASATAADGSPGHGVDILLDDPTSSPPYTVNPDAIGVDILLHTHGAEMAVGNRNCGSRSWYGLADPSFEFTMPPDPNDPDTWWETLPGAKIGRLPRTFAGIEGCGENVAVGCRVALPLCTGGAAKGQKFSLYCVRMATFEITFYGSGPSPCGPATNGNRKQICGELIDEGVALDGRGTADVADPGELVTISLVQ